MTLYNWQDLMSQWNDAVFRDEEIVNDLPVEVVNARWLGYPGATEEQLLSAERRLGISLPLSYREFLAFSNGWRDTSFIYQLWSTNDIEWFHVRHQYWADEGVSDFEDVTEEQHYVYGPAQEPSIYRSKYLMSALEVSARGDSAIYLLNPSVRFDNDEWEAWFLTTWLPGARRYKSFWEMMQAEYEIYKRKI
jgi:hypothetical protein